MFNLWLERPLPHQYREIIDGKAVVIGVGTDTPAAPFARIATADAIIAGAGLHYGPDVIARAPRLRVIARTGIGVNNVALKAATARGIAVCNAPDAPTVATAEHAIALMLAVARRLKSVDKALRAGDTANFFGRYNGLELYGSCLGLLGLGRIGAHVATIAAGIGMKVIAYDPYVTTERAAALGVQMCGSLPELLGAADVVSLHVPLTPQTENLIGADALLQMKRGAILINVSRGGIVDEAALLAALASGQLSGAGLDVFDVEPPPPDHPLLNRDDVVATPHIAGATTAGKDRLWRAALGQTLQWMRGERPPHLVNTEIWA